MGTGTVRNENGQKRERSESEELRNGTGTVGNEKINLQRPLNVPVANFQVNFLKNYATEKMFLVGIESEISRSKVRV